MSNFIALVVEDDILQRDIIVDLLRDKGLEVVECGTAEAAELLVVKTGPELRVLITDVALAGPMSGLQLAEYAKRRYPSLNVVLISGATPPYLPSDTTFLQKPFRAADLMTAVMQ